jgi:hypothetical protein
MGPKEEARFLSSGKPRSQIMEQSPAAAGVAAEQPTIGIYIQDSVVAGAAGAPVLSQELAAWVAPREAVPAAVALLEQPHQAVPVELAAPLIFPGEMAAI